VLLLVAGLLGAVLYAQKRRTGKAGSRFDRRLKVVETLRLCSRNALYLIEMDHRTVLLGMNGSEMKVLAAPTDLSASHPPLLNPDGDPR
jgi:flagellar biogenesis protein FliO